MTYSDTVMLSHFMLVEKYCGVTTFLGILSLFESVSNKVDRKHRR